MKKKPAYMIVYSELKRKIFNEEYKIGDLLPPEPQLEKIFSVSRTTIRKAIDLLSRQGYVSVKPGFGTQVLNPKTIQKLNILTSISQTLKDKGYDVGVQSMFIEKIYADENLASEFGEEEGYPLICINRIQTANNIPVVIAKNYIPENLVPNIEEYKYTITSLYEFLNQKYNINYTRAKDIISASNATFEEATLLNIEPKTALLTIKRICYIQDTPSEIDFVKIVANKYELEVFMKGKSH